MQVKRRINQFFGNILRKDKVTENEDSVPQKQKKKSQKGKNNHSYSQWNLIENIAVDNGNASHCRENKMIYSDGLALPPLDVHYEENYDIFSKVENTKPQSFLKRSSSLFRRSSRKSKKEQSNAPTDELVFSSVEDGSLTNIVKEINETLILVATFGGESQINSDTHINPFPTDDTYSSSYRADLDEIFVETYADPNLGDEYEVEKKDGFRNGLRRKASKLASRFQRAPGSMRLKGAGSSDSFPRSDLVPKRSESFNLARSVEPTEMNLHQRVGSLKRKMSFKKARKGVQKGVVKGLSSFGKTMMSASAVMPVAYECPPASYYPDYETGSPLDVQTNYYRTQSYQQRERYNWGDQAGYHGQSTRPTSFYQHGYCYNG